MKNLMLSLILMMSPLVTMAGTAKPLRIACHFTEPFIVVQIDDSRVKHSDFDSLIEAQIDQATFSGKKVTFKYEIKNSQKQTLEVLLDKKGSDGMSDIEYDAEGILTAAGQRNKLFGGCWIK